VNFVEKKISIDGETAYYIENGEGTDVFFFIPGWAAHPTAYLKFLTIISENYRVISPYPPGFGKSFTPKKLWGTKEYAAFFTKMIKELALKNVTLCAHSSASSFAAQTAAQNSHIKKLILISPYIMPAKNNILRLAIRYTFEYIKETFEAGPGAVLSALKSSFSLLVNAPYIIPFSLSFFSKSREFDQAIFTQLKIPTTIIWGKNDFVFGRTYAKDLGGKFSHANTISVPGMHNQINYHPELIRKFIID